MARVALVHWKAGEAGECVDRLLRAGHEVCYFGEDGGEVTRGIARERPEAVVVDLSRLPSHGRGVATWLRERKATRATSLVFAGGDEERVARARRDFPGAEVTPWPRVAAALRRALARPPVPGVAPPRPDYSGTPLANKLGIRPGSTLMLLGAPAGFDRVLGALPDGVTVRRAARGKADVIVLFAERAADLARRWPAAARAMADGAGLWVAWPKRASGVPTDLDGNAVRAFVLARGLVDHKVCAIDATWSGHRFARRRAQKPNPSVK